MSFVQSGCNHFIVDAKNEHAIGEFAGEKQIDSFGDGSNIPWGASVEVINEDDHWEVLRGNDSEYTLQVFGNLMDEAKIRG
jgi:hypothetical protein